jgi:hypothetical protein
MKSYRLIGVMLVVFACVALAGAALAGKGSKPQRQSPQRARVHAAKPLSKPAVVPTKSPTSGGQPADPDNVQSGDQSSPDQPGEQSSESDNGTDNEAGQQGEPAQGHEDPPGDVNHECTGDCQE